MSDHPALPPPSSQPCTVLQKSLFHASLNTSISTSLVLIERAHYKHVHTDATGISVYALLSQEDSDIKMVIRQNCKDLALTSMSLKYLGICFVNLYLFQSFDDAGRLSVLWLS